MKFITTLILTALLSFVACFYLPWWSIALVSFIVALVIPQHPGKAFIAAFIALFVLWGALTYWISNNNEHILAHKVSLLILKSDSPNLLILATALIGALVASLAALSGSLLRKSKA